MDPTALVTFLFRAPPHVRLVDLLGSWDNFSHAHSLTRDRRRGPGCWTGCFAPLRQGHTYYFFYRLDDALEAYDDGSPYTTVCPLMPGQTVNLLHVPLELPEPPARPHTAIPCASSTVAAAHTWEPRDKYAALVPPPVSRVHLRCISDLALGGRLESVPRSKCVGSPLGAGSWPHNDRRLVPSPTSHSPASSTSDPHRACDVTRPGVPAPPHSASHVACHNFDFDLPRTSHDVASDQLSLHQISTSDSAPSLEHDSLRLPSLDASPSPPVRRGGGGGGLVTPSRRSVSHPHVSSPTLPAVDDIAAHLHRLDLKPPAAAPAQPPPAKPPPDMWADMAYLCDQIA